jgi:hypothetical protein
MIIVMIDADLRMVVRLQEPTYTPTPYPTFSPTKEPTEHPTYEPTAHPTWMPTRATPSPTFVRSVTGEMVPHDILSSCGSMEGVLC